jgi:hypothetical protein
MKTATGPSSAPQDRLSHVSCVPPASRISHGPLSSISYVVWALWISIPYIISTFALLLLCLLLLPFVFAGLLGFVLGCFGGFSSWALGLRQRQRRWRWRWKLSVVEEGRETKDKGLPLSSSYGAACTRATVQLVLELELHNARCHWPPQCALPLDSSVRVSLASRISRPTR